MKQEKTQNTILFRPVTIALGYFVIAVLWIIYSDRFLNILTSDPATIQYLQTIKGLFYVLVTTIALYIFIFFGQRNLKKSADKVMEQEERYRNLVNKSPLLIAVIQNEKVVFANKVALDMLEADSYDQIIGRHIGEFVHADHLGEVKKRMSFESYETYGKDKYPAELNYISVKGNIIPVEVRANPIIYNDEPAWQVLAEDISDRLKRENLMISILDEKNILLSEIHHRVKNNMAIISALLQLQAMEIDDQKVEEKLYESINRVRSIAMIHEQLYESQDLAKINVGDIIRALIKDIQAGPIRSDNVKIDLQLQDLEVNVNKAVSLSLFLNEAISNVFRNSFDEDGICTIDCACEGGFALIRITCNTKTVFPEELMRQDSNLGIHLMKMMAEQLDGEFILEEHEHGVTTGVRFDLKTLSRGASAHYILE